MVVDKADVESSAIVVVGEYSIFEYLPRGNNTKNIKITEVRVHRCQKTYPWFLSNILEDHQYKGVYSIQYIATPVHSSIIEYSPTTLI